MLEWTIYWKVAAALAAIVNPVGAVPVFLNVTAPHTPHERAVAARVAALTVAVVLWVSLISGEALLSFFGVSLASFRVGGGILLLLMSVSMLQGRISPSKHNAEEALEAEERSLVAVVPLGLPLLAGPGAISSVILYAGPSPAPQHLLLLAILIGVVAWGCWACLRLSGFLQRALGCTGINIITRVKGLFMSALAVEFIVGGLRQLLPALAGGN